MKNKGLGRGLDAIFKSDNIESKRPPMEGVALIDVAKISPNPNQPRREFDQEQLGLLAASIQELGLIQPITVKRSGDDEYLIISGERRWRAAMMAGIERMAAYMREVDDEQLYAMALVENLQREDLNPIEVAFGMRRLIDECALTQELLSKRLSMKRPTVSNYLRLLNLPDEVQYALKRGLTTMGHAKAIASLDSVEEQIELLRFSIEEGLSVRDTEEMAKSVKSKGETAEPEEARSASKRSVPAEYCGLESHLCNIFPKGVSINPNKSGGGKIVINYTNANEVLQLIQELAIE